MKVEYAIVTYIHGQQLVIYTLPKEFVEEVSMNTAHMYTR